MPRPSGDLQRPHPSAECRLYYNLSLRFADLHWFHSPCNPEKQRRQILSYLQHEQFFAADKDLPPVSFQSSYYLFCCFLRSDSARLSIVHLAVLFTRCGEGM